MSKTKPKPYSVLHAQLDTGKELEGIQAILELILNHNNGDKFEVEHKFIIQSLFAISEMVGRAIKTNDQIAAIQVAYKQGAKND